MLKLLLHLTFIVSIYGFDCRSLTTTAVKINQEDAPLCVSFQDLQTVFYPKVDDWSLLDISNSSGLILETTEPGTDDIYVTLNIGDVYSLPARHTDFNNSLTVPFFTAIIRLDMGVPTDILWDSQCMGCDQCIDNNCAEPIDKCCTSEGCNLDSVDCDTKIYLGWIGTDKSGDFCLSSGQRYSRFRRYSLFSIYGQVRSLVEEKFEDYYPFP